MKKQNLSIGIYAEFKVTKSLTKELVKDNCTLV